MKNFYMAIYNVYIAKSRVIEEVKKLCYNTAQEQKEQEEIG